VNLAQLGSSVQESMKFLKDVPADIVFCGVCLCCGVCLSLSGILSFT